MGGEKAHPMETLSCWGRKKTRRAREYLKSPRLGGGAKVCRKLSIVKKKGRGSGRRRKLRNGLTGVALGARFRFLRELQKP